MKPAHPSPAKPARKKSNGRAIPNDPRNDSNTPLSRVRPAEPGESIVPEDEGRQFLRDATQQDNYESSAELAPHREPGSDAESDGVPMAAVVSEETLRNAGQSEAAVPVSEALLHSDDAEATLEPATQDVDIRSNVVREASLFDQPTNSGKVRSPKIAADDVAEHILAHEQADDDDEITKPGSRSR